MHVRHESQVVDARRGLRRHLHAAARHHRRQHGAARDPEGPRRQLHRPAVGDRRLRALARRAGAHRRLARRPARPPPRLRDRPRRSSRVASLLCALAPDPTFLNLARGLQGIGGAIMFAVSLALVAQEFPSRPRTRHGDGHLRRDDRHRRRDRPAGRRPADRRPRLGVGLPAQRADRHRRDRRHLLEAGRVAATPTRPGSTGAGCVTFSTRAVPARAGAGARQRRGLGQRR